MDLAALSYPELTRARLRVGRALAVASGHKNAMAVLGAGASLAEDVARNRTLWENPTAPAAKVYTGVLYDAAGAATWDGATMQRAARRVRIVSALWGTLSPADHIPAYRLSMGTTLGRIGPLAAFWREEVGATLTREVAGQLVVDCRSSDYATVWRSIPSDTVAIRVERELNGKRAVVSHNAKFTRGLLTAALVAPATEPSNPDDVAHIATQISGVKTVELRQGTLTIVV